MPIPFILGAAAIIAGVTGVGAGVNGAMKMKDASDTMERVKRRHERNLKRFEDTSKRTSLQMDELGKKELRVLASFQDFANIFEKIQNRPKFKAYDKDGFKIPSYTHTELKNTSVAAAALLSGLGGAALGTAGGFAAAGITTTAVMALGTASTGTAIATLSGAAATNAALAALGGGSLAAGGGGMALGASVLGAATLGVGLLVGGVIFNFTGNSLTEKADEARCEVNKAEKQINKICEYLDDLKNYCAKFEESFTKVANIYQSHLIKLRNLVVVNNRTDWDSFTPQQKIETENLILLVNLLYTMGKVKLVIQSNNKENSNRVNKLDIESAIGNANKFLEEKGLNK